MQGFYLWWIIFTSLYWYFEVEDLNTSSTAVGPIESHHCVMRDEQLHGRESLFPKQLHVLALRFSKAVVHFEYKVTLRWREMFLRIPSSPPASHYQLVSKASADLSRLLHTRVLGLIDCVINNWHVTHDIHTNLVQGETWTCKNKWNKSCFFVFDLCFSNMKQKKHKANSQYTNSHKQHK